MSGYGSKLLCSCVYNSNRTAADVIKKELGRLPFSLGTFSVNHKDSSAAGSVFGLATRKAIFRKGLGCTLVSEVSEQEMRLKLPSLNLPLSPNQDTMNWPLGNLHADSTFEGIHYNKLHAVVNDAFSEINTDSLRRTRAVIVVYKGRIISEKYADGFTGDTRQIIWSATKSITNALTGILVKENKLQISEKNLFDEWKNDPRKNITVDNLLHANSGLKWDEVYTAPSAATNMLFRKGDMPRYAISFALKNDPGTRFQYSSGTSNMLSCIIRQRTGSEYYQFPFKKLFRETGMYSAMLEPDACGTFVGSSYAFVSAKDCARFGLLYLNDGVVNGKRLLPEGWVKYTTTPAKGAELGEYGAQFWLNAGAPGNPSKRLYPFVPADCFWAKGYQGQSIWIIPSKNLVVVRLSLQQGNILDENKFLSGIVAAL